MTLQNPQVFEPQLDEILSGAMTDRKVLEPMLRQLLATRRRYNDPYQANSQRAPISSPDGAACSTLGSLMVTAASTFPGCIGGASFSTIWSVDSQKARIEAGITFLQPIVGAAVGDYPPITHRNAATGISSDSQGNIIPAGKP